MNKVFEERGNLQGFFKKLVLPNAVLNKEITAIINDYIKGGESKVDASIKLATLCNDEITCLEAARMLYDAVDFYSAKRWLQKGNVANTNELFITIENKLSDSKRSLKLPDVLQVIDIKGNSLLAESSLSSSIFEIKNTCDDVSASCKKTWMEEVPNLIEKIGKRLDEEEKERIKKQKEEETARLKRQKAEEDARIKRQMEEEQEEEKKRKKKLRRKIILIYAPIALCLLFMILQPSKPSKPEEAGFVNAFANGFASLVFYYATVLTFYFYYFIYKLIRKLFKG